MRAAAARQDEPITTAESPVRTLIRMAAIMRVDRIGGGYRFDADPAFPLR
jgi:hypothetical protein